MATLTVSASSKVVSGATMTGTVTYSVSSTDNKTTVTISKITHSDQKTVSGVTTKANYCFRIMIDNDTVYFYSSDDPSSAQTLPITTKFDHKKNMFIVNFRIDMWEIRSGGGANASNSVDINIPALTRYDVTYYNNGRGVAPSNPETGYKYYNETLTLADAMSYPDFTFVRWNTKSDNTGTGYNAKGSYTANAPLVLYAIWNRTVSYDANGGSGAPASQTALATSDIILSTAKPTRTGYTFSKWNTKANGGGKTWYPDDLYPAGNPGVTLYAQWVKQTFTVSYNSNGMGAAPSSQTKTYDEALTLADAISVTGFTFVRWNTKSDNTGTGYNAKASYTENAAVTLYAIWNHGVTYNANGGTGVPSEQTSLATSAITLSSTKPTRTGYTFKNWNTKADGSGTSYNPGATFAANAESVTLYAQWTPNPYLVEYNGSEYGVPIPSQEKLHDIPLVLADDPSHPGYGFEFLYWQTAGSSGNPGTRYNAKAIYKDNAPLELYAVWGHSVTYDANGGIGAPPAQSALRSKDITLSKVKPTKSGYLFKTWNNMADGSGSSYSPGGKLYGDQASQTLYAQWFKALESITIGEIKVIRTDTNTSTEESDEGTFAYIEVPVTVLGLAAADVSMTITANAEKGSSPTVTLIKASGSKAEDTTYEDTFIARASNCSLDYRTTFTIKITANNTTYSYGGNNLKETRYAFLTTAFFTMDVKAGGKGIHFGGASTEDGFFVSMPATFRKGISYFADSGEAFLNIKRNDTRSEIHFGIAANGNTCGIYGRPGNKTSSELTWFLRVDGDNVYVNGIDVSTLKALRSEINAVSRDGDTMTGILKFKKSNILDGDIPSSDKRAYLIEGLDSNGDDEFFELNGVYTKNNEIGAEFVVLRSRSGYIPYTNSLGLYFDSNYNAKVVLSHPEAWRSAMNTVNKSGDTMTGVLNIQKNTDPYVATKHPSNAQIGEDIPEETIQMGRHIMLDGTGISCGWITAYRTAEDHLYVNIMARRKNASGTMIQNGLSVGINASGSPTVSVSSPESWRSAIGAAPADTTAITLSNYNSKIVSGTNSTGGLRRHGIVVLNICFQLSAATYANTEALFKVSPAPSQNARFVCTAGGNAVSLRLLTSGECRFNNGITFSSATWILGQIVYAY